MSKIDLPIYHSGDIPYIRISDLPIDQQAPLQVWMYHQTRPLIEGLDPQDAVYAWDYERWLVKQQTGREVWD